MKAMLMCFGVVVLSLAVQAQMSNSSNSKMGGGVEKAIASMEQEWASAAKAGNPDQVAPLLAENFINMDSDGSMRNKAESLARMKGDKWEINQVSDIKVTTDGNTAIATGAWQGKGTHADGTSVSAHERLHDTWMKMPSGKWQCIASASAPTKM